MGISSSALIVAVALSIGCMTGSKRPAALRGTPRPEPVQGPQQEQAPTGSAELGKPGCQPTSPVTWTQFGVEIQGTTGERHQLWGLIMGGYPLRATLPYKFVWRFTGSGQFGIETMGPDAARAEILFGPERHLSSSWCRPGREYGTGLCFPASGCWQIRATTETDGIENASGRVWIRVQPKELS